MVIPRVSVYLATQITPLKSEEKLEEQIGQVEVVRMADEQFPSSRGQEVRIKSGLDVYILVCTKDRLERETKYWAAQNSFWSRKAEKVWEIRHQHVETLFEQKRLADNISRISPISLYDNIISNLAGTDTYHGQYFIDQVRAHRNKYIDYLRAKTDNFSSPLYLYISRRWQMISKKP